MSGPSRTSHSGHSGQSVRGTGVDRSLILTASRVILLCYIGSDRVTNWEVQLYRNSLANQNAFNQKCIRVCAPIGS